MSDPRWDRTRNNTDGPTESDSFITLEIIFSDNTGLFKDCFTIYS